MRNKHGLLLLSLILAFPTVSQSQDSLSRRSTPPKQLPGLALDSLHPASKRTYGRFFPSAVRVGTDVIAIGTSLADKNQKKFEVSADIDLDTYFLSFDYGYSNVTRSITGALYQNKGNYFRIGIDANLLTPDEFRNVILVGLRYGHSFYSDALGSFVPNDPQYGPGTIPVTVPSNSALQAHWAELVFGVKVQVVKQLYLGFTGRFKVKLANSGVDALTPYEIPGYGNYQNGNAFGFNYYLYYRFPFRDKPIVVKPKKKKEPEEVE